MKRRSAHAAAASLLRRRSGENPEPEPSGLSTCLHCRRDYVVPVQWEPEDGERWWMFIRCAECGMSREVTVSNAVAGRYDAELAKGATAISQAAHRLEHERMAAEADRFADLLRHDLIEPADFARAQPR